MSRIGVILCLILLAILPAPAAAYPVATSFQYPLNQGGWYISQDFCVWNTQFGGYHLGEDCVVNDGSELPVYAPANGLVMHNATRTDYGRVVVIEHELSDGSYVCSVHGHMRADGIIAVGTEVQQGDLIGYLSDDPIENGGYSLTHLHFGIREGTYNFWIYFGYASSCTNWYDPSNFIDDHSAPIVVNQTVNIYPTRSNPAVIYAIPNEYGTGYPVDTERNFYANFHLQNGTSSTLTLDNYGIAIFKSDVHQFDLLWNSTVTLSAGSVTPPFNLRGWISDDRLNGGNTTAFTAVVRYQLNGVWYNAPGSDATTSFDVQPRPALANGILVKRPRPESDPNPELAKFYYYHWNYKWWIQTATVANNLFPGWTTEFYVYPNNTIDGLAAPKTPLIDSTVPILTGRNLVIKQPGLTTVYIVEPEPGTTTPLKLRPFANEGAFWSYGYSNVTTPNDMISQTIEITNGWSWLEGQYPIGSMITEPPILKVAPDTFDVYWNESVASFQVDNLGAGDMTWTSYVQPESQAWLQIQSGSPGINSGIFTAVAQVNMATIPRIGRIGVSASGAQGSPRDVYVRQESHPMGNVWYVHSDGSGDYPDIQSAVNASVNGDVILLSDGIFTGTGNKNIDFNGVSLVIRSENNNPALCILDVEGSSSNPASGFFFVQSETQESRIEYITIRNGYESQGAAMNINNSSPIITGCVFEDNVAVSVGGAIFLDGSYEGTISDCVFINNEGSEGGAIYLGDDNCSIVNNKFEYNSAIFGGAIRVGGSPSSITISGNVFRYNSSSNHGTAIIARRCQMVVSGNVFYRNITSQADLGTVFIEPWPYNGLVPTISENTFADNEGTAIASTFQLLMYVENNVFAFSEYFGIDCGTSDIGEPQLSCNIFWGNGGGDTWCGTDAGGNIVVDPIFCDIETGDLTVSLSSKCLPANNTCGVEIGALGQGCDIVTGESDSGTNPYPSESFLFPNYPNPFNPRTTIRFDLPHSVHVKLCVYNVRGDLVATIMDQNMTAGLKEISWNAKDERGHTVSSGIYFYRLIAGNFVQTKKMVLLR